MSTPKPLSENLQKIYEIATYIALSKGHTYIGTEHYVLAIIKHGDNAAYRFMERAGIDTTELRSKIIRLFPVSLDEYAPNKESLVESERATKAKAKALIESESLKKTHTGTEHLLMGILNNRRDPCAKLILSLGKDSKAFDNLTGTLIFKGDFEDLISHIRNKVENKTPKREKLPKKKKKNTLVDFGKDLTKLAQQGNLDPIIGREKQVARILQVLSRRKKNNVIIVGEPGVGKSAIVEALALEINKKRTCKTLRKKKIISLNINNLVAGTKYRGEFEERVQMLMKQINQHTILFIDEIHNIIGTGSAEGSGDLANILKPALAKGELQCIGATTSSEYKKYFEKDGALERRFQKIMVEPTTIKQTIQILNNIKRAYENYHKVRYTKEAIESCVTLTERYIANRNLPDKAIDALDEAGAKANINRKNFTGTYSNRKNTSEKKEKEALDLFSQVLEQLENKQDLKQEGIALGNEEKITVKDSDIVEIVAAMSGIPMEKIKEKEITWLRNTPEKIKKQIIGQNVAVDTICKALQRSRIGLKDPNSPIGCFLFLGQTGVGKTQLSKVLAQEFFKHSNALIRVDMNEYTEKISVSRLIGSAPGYVGYQEGGQLTERVQQNPYSVVLLDEIEKAHKDICNTLLQILDEGFITDSSGKRIDFRNTIIIMTSNIGSEKLSAFGNGVGFDTEDKIAQRGKHIAHTLKKELKKYFSPEFLNRIDDIIIFESLKEVDTLKIVSLELNKLLRRIRNLGYGIKVSAAAKRYLAKIGYSKEYGARPIKRILENKIGDEVTQRILEKEFAQGDTLKIEFRSKKLVFKKQEPIKKLSPLPA